MKSSRQALRAHIGLAALQGAPLAVFVIVGAVFGALSPRFLTGANLENIVAQSSATALTAIGMTFVLLTGGVDLSVGALMFVAAAVGGKLILGGASLPLVLAVMLAVGLAGGAVNALLVTRLRLMPFVVTLATLYLGRGFALWLTETRAMNLPASFLSLGTDRVAGVPLPLWVLAATLAVAHVVLAHTPFGRQVYAVGQDAEAARKAGIATGRIVAGVYVICGVCAAAGGVLALAQLGSVSPTFGVNKEFGAIAAAVLGGTSLFGGRGKVFPGTVLGAVLIQSVESGLVIVNANPYVYPLITSGIIFLAVLTDSVRSRLLARLAERVIRPEEVA